jgi:RNA polymerase sigma-70 factor (ECF subfamily)
MHESASAPGAVPFNRGAVWDEYVRRAAAGEPEGLSSLYDESSSLVYGVILRILGNEADAEEVTSDVYTQVWRQAKNFQTQRGTVQSWLVMLARSRAIDRLRSSQRLKREQPEEEASEFASPDPNPEQRRVEKEQTERVRRALEALAPAQREAIEMAFYGGYTQTELAEKLGQPLGTVKTRIRLGMMKLREHLAAC